MSQVFVSYSHKDREWLDKLKLHLKPLVRDGLDIWDDTRIKAGQNWKEEVQRALSSSRVAVLLISAHFIGSDFIQSDELPGLLSKAETEGTTGTTILCVIVSHSFFEYTPNLAKFQAINPPNRPLIGLPEVDQDQYFVHLARRIKEIFSQDADKKVEEAAREAAVSAAPEKAEQEQGHPEDTEVNQRVKKEGALWFSLPEQIKDGYAQISSFVEHSREICQRLFGLIGAILALCIFVPVMKDNSIFGIFDKKLIFPYEFPIFCEPYLLGLIIAVVAECHRIRGHVPNALLWCYWLCSSASALMLGWFFYETSWNALLAWLPFTGLLLFSVLKMDKQSRWWVARITWNTGGLCALWFVFLIMENPADMLEGLVVSLLASIALVISGLLF